MGPAGVVQARDAAWCEERFKLLSQDTVRDGAYSQLIQRLLAYSEECGGTGVYEARLSMAYSFSGDRDEAKRVAEPYRHHPQFGPLVEYALLIAQVPLEWKSKQDVILYADAHKGFLREYSSQVPEAWGALGNAQTELGEYKEAVESLKRGLASHLDLTLVYRDMAIACEALGRHQDAIEAAEEAYRLDRGSFRDPEFASATAIAFLRVGDPETAENILGVLVSKRPEVRTNKLFLIAVRLLEDSKAKSRAKSTGP